MLGQRPMASEKENMQAFKTIGAAFFAVGLVCAEFLVSGCGASTEDEQSVGPEIGQADEALDSSLTVPSGFGFILGSQVACPPSLASGQFCVVPSSKQIVIGDGFNVAVGPETGVNFHVQLGAAAQRMQTLFQPRGWSVTVVANSSTNTLKFGTLGAGVIAQTTIPFQSGVPCVALAGHGAGKYCPAANLTDTTVFDEHRIALDMQNTFGANLTQIQKENYVYNDILHELGHRIGFGHEGPGVMNPAVTTVSAKDTFTSVDLASAGAFQP